MKTGEEVQLAATEEIEPCPIDLSITAIEQCIEQLQPYMKGFYRFRLEIHESDLKYALILLDYITKQGKYNFDVIIMDDYKQNEWSITLLIEKGIRTIHSSY